MHTEQTPRQRFIAALRRQPLTGLVPHFELVFFLTMEAFGKVHPSQRHYRQWDQMEPSERELHRRDQADLYIATAERFGHSAILLHPSPNSPDELGRVAELIRERSGDRYCILAHGDSTFAIPNGDRMMDFIGRLADKPDALKSDARRGVEHFAALAGRLSGKGIIDGFALCSDYCFNSGPFLSPAQLDEFVFPYLRQLLATYRELGFVTIKHTDGNIMPILDALVECGPDAIHSLDPQGGIDIAEVKRLVGSRVALCGNVNCALMQTGTEAEVVESARYALKNGMPGYGYVFCTSNCVYTGIPLKRYELILDVWRREGVYA